MSIPAESGRHEPNHCVINGRVLGEWRQGYLYLYNSRGNAVCIGVPISAAKR